MLSFSLQFDSTYNYVYLFEIQNCSIVQSKLIFLFELPLTIAQHTRDVPAEIPFRVAN